MPIRVEERNGKYYLIFDDGTELGPYSEATLNAQYENWRNNDFSTGEEANTDFGIFGTREDGKPPSASDALKYYYAGQVSQEELAKWYGEAEATLMLSQTVSDADFKTIQNLAKKFPTNNNLPAIPLTSPPEKTDPNDDLFIGRDANGFYVTSETDGKRYSSYYETQGEAETAFKTGKYKSDIISGVDVNQPARHTEPYEGYGFANFSDTAEELAQGLRDGQKGYGFGEVMNTLIVHHGYSPEDALATLVREEAVDPSTTLEGIAKGYQPEGQSQEGSTNEPTEQVAGSVASWTGGTVTQGFGPTDEELDSEYLGYDHFNKGIDFGLDGGTKIDSNITGTVESVGDAGDGWGHSVKIRDANGYLHNYGHLSPAISVKVGDKITPGMLLGTVASGKSGKSTGSHLSYDVMDAEGNFVEPSAFIGGIGADAATIEGYGVDPAIAGSVTNTASDYKTQEALDPMEAFGVSGEDLNKLFDAAKKAGFTGEALNRAVATALAESGTSGLFGAENRKGENSIGAWQINLDAHADKIPGETMEEKAAWLKDPYNAAQMAFEISSGGTDFSPWTVWHDDRGKPAETVFNTLGGSAGTGTGGTTSEAVPGQPAGYRPRVTQEIQTAEILKAERAKWEAAGYGVFQNSDGTLKIEDYNSGRTWNVGVDSKGKVVSGGAHVSSNVKARGVENKGTRIPEVEAAAAGLEGGPTAMVEAFRKYYPEYGEDYTPSAEELGAAFGFLPITNGDPTRAKNMDVLQSTGGKYIYSDPTQMDGPIAGDTAVQKAQGLYDVIPNLPAQGAYINELGQLVPGTRQERPITMNENERDLYDFSPGLYTGEAAYTMQDPATGEQVAGFTGIMSSPSDPMKGSRIAEAVSSGNLDSLSGAERTELAKAQQEATLAAGTGGPTQQDMSEVTSRMFTYRDGENYVLEGPGGFKKVFASDIELKRFMSNPNAMYYEYMRWQQASLDAKNKSNYQSQMFKAPSITREPSENTFRSPSPPRDRTPKPPVTPITPQPQPQLPIVEPVGPFTTQPVYFAEGGTMELSGPTGIVDLATNELKGVAGEAGPETMTITPQASLGASPQLTGPTPIMPPPPNLPRQGIGGIKGTPGMKSILARAASKYRMQLEMQGISPLMAQELANAKMQTDAGKATLIKMTSTGNVV